MNLRKDHYRDSVRVRLAAARVRSIVASNERTAQRPERTHSSPAGRQMVASTARLVVAVVARRRRRPAKTNLLKRVAFEVPVSADCRLFRPPGRACSIVSATVQ